MRLSLNLSRFLAAAVLLLMFGLALTSMTAESPTFDEQGFLVRGLAWLRGEENGGNRRIRVGHPLGPNALNASLLAADPTVALPSDDPSRLETDFHRPAELFLWEIGNDVEHVMFLARLPTIWLGLLLAAVGGRWAAAIVSGWSRGSRSKSGAPAISGLIALTLLALDPNILAHARLVTTDLGLAAGAVLAGYTLWRFARRPTWGGAAAAGVGLGLLLNTKFTALLFLPLFGIVILLGFARIWRGRTVGDARRLTQLAVMALVVYPVAAFLTLWVGHGLQAGVLDAPLPLFGRLGGASVPLSGYLDQLLDIGDRLGVATPSFLLGRYSDSGWWYYFPVAFLLKTPLPTLLLLGWSFIRAGRMFAGRDRNGAPDGNWFDVAALLIPAFGFFVIALTTNINLGYRHLLPILPFLYVFIGVIAGYAIAAATSQSQPNPARATAALLGWLMITTLWIYPHFLAFFNVLAGGPDNGWRALVDSNLDWGQDLDGLAAWQRKNSVERIWLSYFGEARPEYYGIVYEGLDSFPPRLMDPAARPYYPYDPAPGWYAISATNLQGVHFADHDQFRVLREREPSARIGHSILLYEQPARGEPVDLLLGNLQMDEIAPEDFALLGTNDVTPRWFDGAAAIIIPDGSRPLWLVVGEESGGLGDWESDGEGLYPLLRRGIGRLGDWEIEGTAEGDNYRLYRVAGLPEDENEGLLFAQGERRMAFVDAPVLERDGTMLTAVTAWRQEGEPSPIKQFVHVLDESGHIVAQWDGLGAAWQGWRTGDTLIQAHEISLADLTPGVYRVVTGMYDPKSLERLRSTSGADVIELGQVTVP